MGKVMRKKGALLKTKGPNKQPVGAKVMDAQSSFVTLWVTPE